MHNVRKVKTSEDKKREKLEQSKKMATEYSALLETVIAERSQKNLTLDAFKLTTKLLNMSADCYSIWNYRKEILTDLETTLPDSTLERYKDELKWIEQLLPQHPKSYWVWFHRKWLVLRIPDMDWSRELSLCTRALDLDIRNFHCWNYRRFVTNYGKVTTQSELDYTTKKIEQNFSNYSSWHQRSYLLKNIANDNPEQFVSFFNGRIGTCTECLLHQP